MIKVLTPAHTPKAWKHQSKVAQGGETKKKKNRNSILAFLAVGVEPLRRTKCRVVQTETSPCSLDGSAGDPPLQTGCCIIAGSSSVDHYWEIAAGADGSCFRASRWDGSRHLSLRGKVGFSPLYCKLSSGDSLKSVLRKRSMIIMSSAGKSGRKNKP